MRVIGIIATKNRVALLEKAVNSALNQTDKLDALYVVSDSTDDNFFAEKELLKDKKCYLLRDKYTHNYAGNLNTAIDEIILKHKDIDDIYIAFLDDDDYWDTSYISECKSACLNIDFIVCGLRCNMDDYKYDLDIPHALSISDFLKGNPGIQGSNTFIKLSTLLKAGCFDENMSSTTDRDLFTRVMKLNPTYISTNKYLVYVNSSNKRVRITNSSEIKKDGLSKFYYKYSDLMTGEDKIMFLQRAKERFNLDEEELNFRADMINKSNEKENDFIGLHMYLHPELFSCNKDLIYLIDKYYQDKKEDDYSKLVHESLITFYKKDDCFIKETALLLMEDFVLNFDYTRVDLYSLYLKIRNYIFAKYIRKQYIDNNKFDSNLLSYNDEAEIKAVFDYVRHKITTKNTIDSFMKNEQKIKDYLKIANYKILGYGSEGFVFSSSGFIYKWFKKWDSKLIDHLYFLKDRIQDCKYIYDFEILTNGEFLFIKYPFIEASDIHLIKQDEIMDLIENFKSCGLCLTNIKNRNFVRDHEGIKYIDYGFSIKSYNQIDYRRSKKRAKQLVDNLDKSNLEFYKLINESYILGGE